MYIYCVIYPLDVSGIIKDAHVGETTSISCSVTGITTKATISWNLNGSSLSSDEYDEGNLDGTSQTSVLTVSSPADDNVYTCIVTSGQYDISAPSEITVSLNTYCKYNHDNRYREI